MIPAYRGRKLLNVSTEYRNSSYDGVIMNQFLEKLNLESVTDSMTLPVFSHTHYVIQVVTVLCSLQITCLSHVLNVDHIIYVLEELISRSRISSLCLFLTEDSNVGLMVVSLCVCLIQNKIACHEAQHGYLRCPENEFVFQSHHLVKQSTHLFTQEILKV